MPGPTTVLSSGKTLAEICRAAQLGDDALALLGEGTDGRGYVERLAAEGHAVDALRLLAHALPQRPAVWWAWVCARRAHGETPPAPVQAALDATKLWIGEPTDANRRDAMRCATEANFRTPPGCAGLAAFLCGELIAPPERDPVPPGEYAAAQAIAGCITVAAVFTEPERAEEKFQEFLTRGLEVAEKTRLWDPPPQGSRQ